MPPPVVYAPLFHRARRKLPEADRFAPELWLGEDRRGDWPLIPFSDGPAFCPGRNLVLLAATTMLAAVLERHEFRLQEPEKLSPERPLPSVLSPYQLRFRALERSVRAAQGAAGAYLRRG